MSSKARTAHSNFVGILLFVLFVAGLIYVAQVSSNQGGAPTDVTPEGIPAAPDPPPSSPGPSASQTEDKPSTASTTLTPPPVLLTRTTGTTTELIVRTDGDQVLFTDADAARKIQTVLGLRGSLAYVIAGTDTLSGAGQIATIKLDGSGALTTVSDQVLSVSPPALHPSEDRVALVSFDNAERSFGFALFSPGFDGKGKLTIDFAESGIGLPAWSPDGRLAYVTGQATPETGVELRIASINGTPSTLYTSAPGVTITDLVWQDTATLLAAVAPLAEDGPTKTKIIAIKTGTGTASDLLDQPGQERDLVASNGLLGYLVSSATTTVAGAPGDLYVTDLASGQTITKGSATHLVGWMEEE